MEVGSFEEIKRTGVSMAVNHLPVSVTISAEFFQKQVLREEEFERS